MSIRSARDLLVSVIVPVHNEEGNVALLARRVSEAVASTGARIELVFVDDGSSDATVSRVLELAGRDADVRLLPLSRNFGHQVALTAGLDACRGDLAITMDGDLQHPPELLPTLVRCWEEGYDVVLTVREDSEDVSLMKAATSSLFYRIINALSDVKMTPSASDFRLLDRSCIDALCQLRERDRFLRGLVSWIGYNQCMVPYQAAVRHSGRSKYTWRAMFRFAVAGLSSFSAVPLRFSLYLGLVMAAFSFLYALFVVLDYSFRLTGAQYVWGWTTIVCLVTMLSGIQLIMLGIMGEYLFRLYQESKHRPIYLIKQNPLRLPLRLIHPEGVGRS